MTIKERIQYDLDAGRFNRICSNEDTFKQYIFGMLDKQEAEIKKQWLEEIKAELKKQKECKHNGGKGYWSNLPGYVCLKCGKEIIKDDANK
jgi:hypothetical protein